MSYSDYKKISEEKVVKLDASNSKEMENTFWAQITKGAQYSLNNKFSLFGDSCQIWNLDRFTKKESLIHSTKPHQKVTRDQKLYKMPGIQSPYTYVGQAFSSFGMHLEDGNLGSINFLHSGAEKLWYIIPKEENHKLERFCKKVSKNVACTFYLRHKTLMISPSILKKNGIKFARVCLTLIFFSFYFPPMCYYSYLSILFY